LAEQTLKRDQQLSSAYDAVGSGKMAQRYINVVQMATTGCLVLVSVIRIDMMSNIMTSLLHGKADLTIIFPGML